MNLLTLAVPGVQAPMLKFVLTPTPALVEGLQAPKLMPLPAHLLAPEALVVEGLSAMMHPTPLFSSVAVPDLRLGVRGGTPSGTEAVFGLDIRILFEYC